MICFWIVSIPVVNNKVREDMSGISVLSLPAQCHFDSSVSAGKLSALLSSQWAYIQIQPSSTLCSEEIRWRKLMFLCCLKYSGLKQERFSHPQLLTYLPDWDLIQRLSLTTSWLWDFCYLECFLSWATLDWCLALLKCSSESLCGDQVPGNVLSLSSTADVLLCTYRVP